MQLWRKVDAVTEPKILKLRLSARSRELLSEYGYPFEDFGKQLSGAESVKGISTLTIEPFYFDALRGELVRSAKEIEDEELLEEIDALYSELEHQAAQQQYRRP